jgi:23S rRNA pseudouridine1911/1915/1917 synthase
LAEQLTASHSRTRLQQLLKAGHLSCNGKVLDKSAYRLQAGDELQLQLPPNMVPTLAPENLDLPIIWQDAHVIVVNKPAGMLTHPTPHQLSGTMVNALLYHCHGELSGINGVLRPGIVHRLDKDTSGLLMVAKTDIAHRGLSDQLQPFIPNRARRSYRAIVQGTFTPEQQGSITQPLMRSDKNRQKIMVDVKGRDAQTDWLHLQTLAPPLHLLEARLHTGRTHQIRVHFAWAGFPILGDPLYGTGLAQQKGWPVKRQLLQAYALTFTHPVSGELLSFDLPMDADFLPYMALQ